MVERTRQWPFKVQGVGPELEEVIIIQGEEMQPNDKEAHIVEIKTHPSDLDLLLFIRSRDGNDKIVFPDSESD